jgi:hypothetical protein
MATLKNFNTALYVMRLDADCKYKGLLKIGISNNVARRLKEIGNVKYEWMDNYRAPRAVVMATEMLAQCYAYLKVGRPKNFRQALPVRSGSSEFFNTDNIRQARGFVIAAKRYAKTLVDLGYDTEKQVESLIRWTKAKFQNERKRLPQSFRLEVARIYPTLEQEKAA